MSAAIVRPLPTQTNAMLQDVPFLRRLRLISFIEGLSTLTLFGVAMPLKYLANMPSAVTVVGSLHGVLFVGLVVMVLMAEARVPLSRRLTIACLIAAVVPLGPFFVDRYLAKLESDESADVDARPEG
jgi:integral membrane protein